MLQPIWLKNLLKCDGYYKEKNFTTAAICAACLCIGVE